MSDGLIKPMRWMRFLFTIPLSLAIFTVCAEEIKVLNLHDAILLSLRYNASVRMAELNRVVQKFQLEVAEWNQFAPKYGLTAGTSWATARTPGNFAPMTPSWTVGPSVSWTSPIGTDVNVGPNGTWGNGAPYSPGVSVTITQPLISGFGKAVVEAALEEAYNAEKTNKLGLKSAIMTQVTNTIHAYMTLVEDEDSVNVDQDAVDRAKTNLFQTKLLIQAGQNPQSDEIQAESQVAQALSTLQSGQSQLVIDRYALLQTIGLDPQANIRVIHDVPLEKYHLLSEDDSVKETLANNIGYQTDIITIADTARNVMLAKDANRWKLNFEEQYSRGGSGATDTAVNNILNNSAYSSVTSLNLTVPIDNKSNQEAILSASVALETAELNLKQEKQNLIIQAMSAHDGLLNTATQITLDENQVKLDKQTLANTMRSYRAGMSSSLQVTQQSQTLATDQRNLVTAQISYFNALASFDQVYGHTLETWGIHVQY